MGRPNEQRLRELGKLPKIEDIEEENQLLKVENKHLKMENGRLRSQIERLKK